MEPKLLEQVNTQLKLDILKTREQRQSDRDIFLSELSPEIRFIAKWDNYHIKELMVLAEKNQQSILPALIMKSSNDRITGYKFIQLLKKHPAIFICLLSVHPQSKAKVNGKLRFIMLRFLSKSPKLFNLIRELYLKLK